MNQPLTYRSMRPDELPKWLDFLYNEIFPGDPRESVESLWHHDDVKDPNGVFLALDAQENIVGSLKVGCRWISLCGSSTVAGIISGVGVQCDYRGQGITRRLFALCDDYMRSKHAKVAHLYSKPDTLSFYLHMGFSYLPQRPGEDFFRMYRVPRPFALRNLIITDTGMLTALLSAYPH